ncbi:hypothetical protein HYFRA_00000385 [Hymenoscyphus fraxineus]|uniref:Choline kinase N-terminal domain-containing protein n=1 Tax=Hymenoscyphus fraxineus TaxID=746836 RepID=A0A9N9PSH7_9HELO|nr:hypothetical protein HYFRA_00000385 [Hymenoscyphus fraxineus]
MSPAPAGPSPAEGPPPLRPALKSDDTDETYSPKTGPKVVSIAEGEPEPIPPLPPTYTAEETRIKQFPAGVAGRRLSGRPNMAPSSTSSRISIISQSSLDDGETSSASKQTEGKENKHHHMRQLLHHRHRHEKHEKHDKQENAQHHQENKLLTDVLSWLQAEKFKRAARRSKRKGGDENGSAVVSQEGERPGTHIFRPRTASTSSDSSCLSLDKLQRILEDNMSNFGYDSLPSGSPTSLRRPSVLGRRRSSAKKLGGGVYSSDTEYQDGDVVVPSCDVVLDNSKTMSYGGGGAVLESSDTTVTLNSSKRAEKERKHWAQFKSEIVRLAHTLRLKGWRKVPLERGSEIEVERLSGALTNAVYVVSPPKDLPVSNLTSKPHSTKPPPKLFLRIYGPQVEHLIDRENELGILKRLARKKIGPRLLGTFTNGRFEEYFNATTLKANDLRVTDTSKQIAKRMRELHEGIDLLDREREEGPFVWRNWDKWVDRCQEVITYLDGEILSKRRGKGEGWRERGLVCGVEWKVFKSAVDKYRKWLDEYYKMKGGVESRLVFAHNDTQYGNILRLVPAQPSTPSQGGTVPPPSPLLLPANHHKQLIVIDFEYASANTPGLEFANHFTEWCYNYHDPTRSWACNTDLYPTIEQQRTFIRSYVNHRPQYNPRASATPKLQAMDSSTSSMRGGVNEFLLDSRAPGGVSNISLPSSALGSSSTSTLTLNQRQEDSSGTYVEEEKRIELEIERRVQGLMEETRIWRLANSAQWVAWGIVQAKVPGLDGEETTGYEEEEEIATSPMPKEDDGHHINGSLDQKSGTNGIVSGEVVKDGIVEMNGEKTHQNGEKEPEEGLEEEDEFDYLAYAQHRALFFWGDVLSLGIMSKEELPESLVAAVNGVEY